MQFKINRELMLSVLNNENIGIWVIELEHGKESRMYMDETSKNCFAITNDMSPEDIFRYWYDNIHEDYTDEILDGLEEMKQGQRTEVNYIWRHPKRGLIHIRYGGVCDPNCKDMLRLEGCTQDVTQLVKIQRKVDRLSKKTRELESLSHEQRLAILSFNKVYFAVHHLNMVSAEFNTVQLQEGVSKVVSKAKNIYEAMDVFCEKCVLPEYHDRMKVFTELSTLKARIGDKDMISEECVSINAGWVSISFIVAERTSDGDITDVIFTGRRIDREKKEARSIDNMLRALSAEYLSVYRVNVETDECFSYRMSNAITGQFGNQFAVSSYANSFRIYKEQAVLEEDWYLFEQIDTVRKVKKIMKGRNDYMFPYRVFRNGEIHHFIGRIVRVSEDAVEYVFGFKNNDEIVEEQKVQEQKLREALSKAEKAQEELRLIAVERDKAFRIIHETLNSGMWSMKFDEYGGMNEVIWSDEFRHMIGYKSEKDFPNTIEAWIEKIHPDDVEYVRKEYYDTINDYTGDKTCDVEYRMQVKNGEWRWFHTAGRLSRRDNGTPEAYSGLFVDITDKKYHMHRESKLEKQALQDSLTGLPNRRAYDNALARIGEQDSLENISIIALDVNYLKKTNDSLGHAAGDELLIGAARCIENSFGKIGTCFRIGGDEFMVIIEREEINLDVLIEAFAKAQKNWQGKNVKELSIAAGYVRANEQPFATMKRLLQIADDNMYENKKKMKVER